ncbi:GNAT family N-acetyltransferase [Patescibacteria group bacterium]
MRIRKMRVEDAAEVVRLHRGTIRAINSQDYAPGEIAVWAGSRKTAWLRSHFGDELRFVAEEGGKIVGFANVSLSGDELQALYVHKNYQGHGIGSKLLAKAEATAKKLGNSEIRLFSTLTAKTFYQGHGYKSVKRTRLRVQDITLPTYLMKKKLG